MRFYLQRAGGIFTLMLVAWGAFSQSTDPNVAFITRGKDYWPAAAGIPTKGLFNPLYFRAGLMTGILLPTGDSPNGTTLGIRTEYGLSKLFSIVGDAQAMRTANSFSQGQASLAARYMPFNFSRFQPYVSVGFGAGSAVKGGHGHGNCHGNPPPTTTAQANGETTTTVTTMHHHLRGFALVQVGVNFKVNAHFIAHAEGSFQTPFKHFEPGGLALRAGMSYQFGRN
jgi:hypothetical protein